jgi:hypothetical protein
MDGNAPDKAVVALVPIDVINDMEFAEGDRLLEFALPMARQILELKRRAKVARSSLLRPIAIEPREFYTNSGRIQMLFYLVWSHRPWQRRQLRTRRFLTSRRSEKSPEVQRQASS